MTALTPAPRAPLFFPFQFARQNAAPIVRRIWIPCLAGALSIYGFFSAYMWELQAYLSNPQDSVGSRVLGSAALALLVLEIVPGVEQAVFYSMQYYTTLGANVHKLPESWAGFGGFEAMTGMLMFGWSTAILALVGQKMHSIDD